MATLRQIRDRIDGLLADWWRDHLLPKQQAYYAAHGRYWQGLRSHTATPADNTDFAADRLDNKPPHRAETWRDMQLSLPSIPMCVWCDEYRGPQGDGFVATVEVQVSDKTYRRSKGYGPEERGQAWHEVVEIGN